MASVYHPPTFITHLANKRPMMIFHYTTQEGLLGIIGERGFRATKIHFMNDSTEFTLVFDLVEEYLRSLARRKSASRTELDMIRPVHGRFTNMCVVCFCTNGDLLSQWRGYSGDSYGYSIGFRTNKLMDFATPAGFLLAPCIYNKNTQKHVVREICDHFLQERRADSYPEFLDSIVQCGSFFKDPSFREEDEWRLLSAPVAMEKLQFKKGKSAIIPYSILRFRGLWEDEPVDSVTIGPCPQMRLARLGVQNFLHRENIGERISTPPGLRPKIQESAIPYRSW